MSSTAAFLAVAILLFAVYMLWLSNRSARGAMGRNGPGVRIAETTACEHTWVAAQHVAAPIYRLIAFWLSVVALITLGVGFLTTAAAVVVGLVGALGVQVFLLGVASVRARKAAAAVRCEHKPQVSSPRATPPHRKTSTNNRARNKKKRR